MGGEEWLKEGSVKLEVGDLDGIDLKRVEISIACSDRTLVCLTWYSHLSKL